MATNKQPKQKKLNAEERKEREAELVKAITAGLVATVRDEAKSWALKARDLRVGLSKTAIRRAEDRAHELADERPPGFVPAMEAIDAFDDVCEEYGISKRDQDTVFGAVAKLLMSQLASRTGPFYEAAKYFGLTMPSLEDLKVRVVRLSAPDGVCDCPSCRPRTAEELN